MPNIDGGHYFLTALVPIMLSDEIAADGSLECPSNRLRKLLALMPTTGGGREALAGTDVVFEKGDKNISPFARNDLNHFARFARKREGVNHDSALVGHYRARRHLSVHFALENIDVFGHAFFTHWVSCFYNVVGACNRITQGSVVL